MPADPKTPKPTETLAAPSPARKPPKRGHRLPPWFKVPLPGGERYRELKRSIRDLKLATVCEEARCPNLGECWMSGTATLMVLGDTCTRACRFCAVKTGNPRGALDEAEPENAAAAVEKMADESGISYVVLTSVDRDDLDDLGAGHYARCVEAIKRRLPKMGVEVLTPDFQGRAESVGTVVSSGPDVFAHNIETVRRLHRRVRDGRAGYEQSLAVLETAREAGVPLTKSGLMVGHGEGADEVVEAMEDLRARGVEVLTIGQYLQPTPRHLPVERMYPPEELDELREEGERLGFLFVASGPLVRSSYRAGEHFIGALSRRRARQKED